MDTYIGNLPFVELVWEQCSSVADLEGVQGVSSNPPLDPKYFIFMGNFKRFCVKVGKRTPFSTFEPPLQKSWIRPCSYVIACLEMTSFVYSSSFDALYCLFVLMLYSYGKQLRDHHQDRQSYLSTVFPLIAQEAVNKGIVFGSFYIIIVKIISC